MPILGAPLIAAISAVIVAWINKRKDRVDPIEYIDKANSHLQSMIDQLQEDRQDDKQLRIDLREVLKKTEAKVVELSNVADLWRAHAIQWEMWHADGMPDPPGPPKRPNIVA